MRFSYRLSHLCGTVHTGGNLTFGPDGNTIYSVVHNRVSVFDLVGHSSSTLPYEHTSAIRRIAISPDNRFLLSVDEGGYLLLVHLRRRLVLCRMRLKRCRRVRDLQFSPDGQHFAVTQERQMQVWRTPGRAREYAPFVLHRTYGSHHDDITSVRWSGDGRLLCTASKDLTIRVWAMDAKQEGPAFVPATLSGHRDRVVGAWFGDPQGRSLYSVARDGFLFHWDKQQEEGGQWRCQERHVFKKERTAVVSGAELHAASSILVVGFSNGVFGLYEMPDCSVIHTLSVSQGGLGSVALNRTGEWLALGCAPLGQLLVWEWQSETYVLKQQGHGYDSLNTLAYSPDGQLIATGGEDSKVKLWSTASGFCHVTFSEHSAPVTGLAFLPGAGQALLSCSLDGTVRAHDLIRYKNFRTLTTPQPTQLVSLAVDPSGEVVCAGSLEPFEVYVWSLQTGRLLDVLAGHGGPVVALDYNPQQPILASGSWDGTVKMWNVFKNELIETYSHSSDVLAVAFRPDGKQLCVATLSGLLSFWDVVEGKLQFEIEGRRDISGGRAQGDRVTAKNSAKSKHFTSVTYTADGACVLAGGRSRFVCIYHVESRSLVKKFQISHDRRLDGVLDELNSADMTAAGMTVHEMDLDGDDSEGGGGGGAAMALPGAKRKDDGSRNTRLEARTTCVRFSGTGLEWAAASPLGLLVYSLDEDLIFDPLDIDEQITPASIRRRLESGEYAQALMMAVQLNEEPLLLEALEAVPYSALGLTAAGLSPTPYVPRLLQLIAKRLPASPHLQYLLHWARLLLQTHGAALRKRGGGRQLATYRSLLKAVMALQQDLARHSDDNAATLQLLAGAAPPAAPQEEQEGEEEEEEEGLGAGELVMLPSSSSSS